MIRVVEAFSGYGSQSIALSNIGVEHTVVATMDIDEDAIIAYWSLRGNSKLEMEMPSKMLKVLKNKGIGANVDKMPLSKLKKLYTATMWQNNLGDISKITAQDIPAHDLFVYTFPCTDISIAGKQDGLIENSGTSSSLLWECRKVIEHHKPPYLFMENVSNLLSPKHIDYFNTWLEWLESQGYSNYYKVVNALDFGSAQNRERVFMVSMQEDNMFLFPKGVGAMGLDEVLDVVVDTKYDLTEKESEALGDEVFENKYGVAYSPNSREYRGFKNYSPTLCARDYKGPKICTIPSDDGVKVRRVTPREYWRLMGNTDEHFDLCVKAGLTDSALYKLAGNSIEIKTLEAIFEKLFLER